MCSLTKSLIITIIISLHNAVIFSNTFSGLIGCKFVQSLCLDDEICINDNPFGSCSKDQLLNGKGQVFSASQLVVLGTALNQLATAGFSWNHLYTQCKLHLILQSFRDNIAIAKDYCSSAVQLIAENKQNSNQDSSNTQPATTSDELIKDFYISRNDLNLLKDFFLQLNNDKRYSTKKSNLSSTTPISNDNKLLMPVAASNTLVTVSNTAVSDNNKRVTVSNSNGSITNLLPSEINTKSIKRVFEYAIMSAQGNQAISPEHLRHKLITVVYILVILALLLTCVLVVLALVWRRMRQLEWQKFKLDDDAQSVEYEELCRDDMRTNSPAESMPISEAAIYSDIIKSKMKIGSEC